MNEQQSESVINLIKKNYYIEMMHEKSDEQIYVILGFLKIQINSEWIHAIRYAKKECINDEFARSIYDMHKLRVVYMRKK